MRALRRLLLVALMIAVGLTAVWLLSGERLPAQRGTVRAEPSPGAGAGDDALVVEDPGKPDGPTRISFQDELEFEMLDLVEQPDGSLVERVVYRVHMMSGRPTDDGHFIAERPTITFIDEVTGEPTGSVTSDEARFVMSQSVGGRVTIVEGQMATDRFTLTGHVRGDFALDEGDRAHLQADEIVVDGLIVQGPGLVTWTRAGLRLEGTDFTWDGETGRLNYVYDALLVLEPSPERPGLDLFAPGGLTWTIPPDAEDPRVEGYGELRGRVSGVSGDGSRLGADTVFVRTSTLVLAGSSVYERRDGDDIRRVTARRITVTPDSDGVFSFAEADGDVHVVSAPFALVPAWMLADHLVIADDDVSSAGEVEVVNGEVTATGTRLDGDLATGVYEYRRDAVLDVAPDSASALAGLLVTAPGGMTIVVPPGADRPGDSLTGELRGGVTGTLPDGTTFDGDVFTVDAPRRAYVLDGGSSMYLVEQGGTKALESRRVRVETDDAGALALVSAEGEVVLLSSPVDVLPTRVVAGRLDMSSPFVTSPGEVTWTRGDMTALGTGMTWNEETGELEFDRSAVVTVFDPERRLEAELRGDGGLTWHAPAGSMRPFDEGRGELRGRVTGRSSDGSTLETETLLVDGEASTMRLQGHSTVAWTGEKDPMTVSSSEFVVEGFGDDSKVTSSAPVDWVRPDMTGRGTGMTYERALGRVDFARDAHVEIGGTERSIEVDARGGFTWNQPRQAGGAGFGELRDGVRGRTSDGGAFLADTLWIDGRTQNIRMRGRSQYERMAPDGSVRLDAARRIDVELEADGTISWLEAEDAVEAWLWPTAATAPGSDATQVLGDRLLVDEPRNEVTTWGERCSYETLHRGELTTIHATESIHVRTDAQRTLSWVRAVGNVETVATAFMAHCRRLVWNVIDDHATLTGDCRLFTGGAWMTAPLIDLWPDEERWHIPQSTIRLEDRE